MLLFFTRMFTDVVFYSVVIGSAYMFTIGSPTGSFDSKNLGIFAALIGAGVGYVVITNIFMQNVRIGYVYR